MEQLDLVLAEIIRNRLVAVTQEMAKTMIRTAFNPLLYEVKDFSVTLMSKDTQMWAETPGVIVFSQGFPEAVRGGIERWEGRFSEGDVLIVNDPFETGTHISDTNVYMPVFFDGNLIAFCGVAAHWADVGGKNPGGWCPDTTDMYQEGLCFRHLKIVEAGVRNDGLWDLIADNVRVPNIVRGDLEAQIAACRQGAERVQELCRKYGAQTVERSMAHIIRETDRAMRKLIAQLPNGEHQASLRLDGDGVDPNGEFRVCLGVRICDDTVSFSFQGSSPTAAGPVNLPAPSSRGILASTLKGLLMPYDPCNAGHTMCLSYDLPQDSIINPTRPAPTDSYGYLVVCLMELMFRCLVGVVPDRCPSGGYQLTGAMISRTRAQFGRPFVMIDAMHGGNGALCDYDGVTNQLVGNGDLPNNPVEVTETRHPVRINRLEFAADVAGPGRYRGGMGVRKEYQLLEPGCSVSFVIENTVDVTSTGVFDGEAGTHGTLTINPGSPNAVKLTHAQAALGPFPAGTIIEVVTGGGGGWGDRRTRDPDRVLKDVRNGFISAETAREVYAVAVLADGGDFRLDPRGLTTRDETRATRSTGAVAPGTL